ncbi:hypothetical protein AMEX_G21172, partial [Astyanax mexicanus]
MEAFREFVLRRDALCLAKTQLGSKAPTAAAERQPSSSGPAEVTDAELLYVEEPSAVVPSCSFSPIPFWRGWTHSSTGPKIPPTAALKKTPPTAALKKTPPTAAVKKTPPTPAATTTPPVVASGSLPVLAPQALQQESQIMKKLAGDAAGTAAWATNVGNEHGQVLTTVLTSHEGPGLVDMVSGLMKRYRDAMEPPPRVIYVDRDCCSLTGSSSVAKLFHEWEDEIVVRLDVWHLMRRFASAVTTESHQLYGAFMSGLSGCIFEWDAGDVTRLREAKRSELEGKRHLFGLSDNQTGSPLPSISDDHDVPEDLLDELEPDEGFGEDAEVEDPTLSELSDTRQSHPCLPEDAATVASRSGLKRKKDSDESSEGSQGEAPPLQEGELRPSSVSLPHNGVYRYREESHGPDGAPGYEHVVNLATALVGLRKLTHLTDSKVDKERSVYPPRHQDRLTAGRFKATKYTSGTPGVESLKRCLLGETTGPAQWPDASRVVEAVCRQLCDLHPSSVQTKGVRVERWALILQDYHSIRQLVLNAPTLMSRTTLQLFEINRQTLMQWFNKRQKAQERAVLLQGVERPSASAVAQDPLPLPREQPLQPPTFAFQPFTFASLPNTAGQAVRRRQKTEMPQPPQAPGARLILPAASASQTQPVCIFISPPTSSHIPVPAFQPVQHTVQPPTAVTGAAAAQV